MRKIYTNMHKPQFFQRMLLISKFLHREGASPCFGKHCCTSSEKKVFSRSIENKPVNCQLCIKGKQTRYFVWRFQNYMDPCAYLSKWSRYAPACVQVLFAVGLKACFSFISTLFLIKCIAKISFNQKIDSIKTHWLIGWIIFAEFFDDIFRCLKCIKLKWKIMIK